MEKVKIFTESELLERDKRIALEAAKEAVKLVMGIDLAKGEELVKVTEVAKDNDYNPDYLLTKINNAGIIKYKLGRFAAIKRKDIQKALAA